MEFKLEYAPTQEHHGSKLRSAIFLVYFYRFLARLPIYWSTIQQCRSLPADAAICLSSYQHTRDACSDSLVRILLSFLLVTSLLDIEVSHHLIWFHISGKCFHLFTSFCFDSRSGCFALIFSPSTCNHYRNVVCSWMFYEHHHHRTSRCAILHWCRCSWGQHWLALFDFDRIDQLFCTCLLLNGLLNS